MMDSVYPQQMWSETRSLLEDSYEHHNDNDDNNTFDDFGSVSTGSKLVNITTTTISSSYGHEFSYANNTNTNKMDPPATYQRQKSYVTTISTNATAHVCLISLVGVGGTSSTNNINKNNSNENKFPKLSSQHRQQLYHCRVGFASSSALSMQVGSSRLCPYTGLLVIEADQQKVLNEKIKSKKQLRITNNDTNNDTSTNEFYWSNENGTTKHLSVVLQNNNPTSLEELITLQRKMNDNNETSTDDSEKKNDTSNVPDIVEITVTISESEGTDDDVAQGIAFLVLDNRDNSRNDDDIREGWKHIHELPVRPMNLESAKYFGNETILTVTCTRDDFICIDGDNSSKIYPPSPSFVSSQQKLRAKGVNISHEGTATTVKESDDDETTHVSFTKSMMDRRVRPLLQKLTANENAARLFQRSCSEQNRNKNGKIGCDDDENVIADETQKNGMQQQSSPLRPVIFQNLTERLQQSDNNERHRTTLGCTVSLWNSWEQLRYVVTRCTHPTNGIINRRQYRSATHFDDGVVLPPHPRRRQSSYYNFNDNDTMLSTIATRESWGK